MKTQVELAAAIRAAQAADLIAGHKTGIAIRIGRFLNQHGFVDNLKEAPSRKGSGAFLAYRQSVEWWAAGYFGSARVRMDALAQLTARELIRIPHAGPKTLAVLKPFLAQPPAVDPPFAPAPSDAATRDPDDGPELTPVKSPVERARASWPSSERILAEIIDFVMGRLDKVTNLRDRIELYRWVGRLNGEFAELLSHEVPVRTLEQ